MQITEAILHKIEKESGITQATLVPREEILPDTAPLDRLADQISARYTKDANTYGSFGDEPYTSQYPSFLDSYISTNNQELGFVEFSKRSAELVRHHMASASLATSSFIIFLRYQSNQKDWLLVLMLKTEEQTGINEETLELNESIVFRLEDLHEAARFDIQKWRDRDTTYLSFVKPRQGKEGPSRFFLDALGCTDYSSPRANTQEILKALTSYMEENNWDHERKSQAKKAVHDYFEQQRKAKEPVNVVALAAYVNNQNPTEFRNYIRDNDIQVNDAFKPDKNTYSRLRKFSKSFANIKVSFDLEDLENCNVELQSINHCCPVN